MQTREQREQSEQSEQSIQLLKKLNSLQRSPYSNKRILEGDEGNPGLSQITAVLRRRIALIFSVAFFVTSAASVWSSTRTPIYQGKFQLLVEPLKTSDHQLLVLLSETLKQDVNEITKQNTTALDYQALMEVLKSPKLMNPVVQKLQIQYPDISYSSLVGYGNGKSGKLQFTRIVKGKDESRVIEVNYQDPDPQKIQQILRQVSEAYIKYSVEEQHTSIRQGINFVEQQIPKLRARVSLLQRQLQSFQQQYGVYNPELQGGQLLTKADQLKAQQLELQQKLAEQRSLYDALQKQVGVQQNVAIAASALSESPQYQQILTRVREVEAKIATESVRSKDANPVLLSLREERRKLLQLLNQEAQAVLGNTPGSVVTTKSQALGYQNSVRRDLTSQLVAASAQIQSLQGSQRANSQALALLAQQVKAFPAISGQYTNYQRELQVATDTLNQLLAKQEALRVNAAQEEIPWELITPPTIPHNQKGQFVPQPSNKSRDLALGGVAGLLMGMLAALVADKGKNFVYTNDEVTNVTLLSILGTIPLSKEVKKVADACDVVILTQKPDSKSGQSKTVKVLQQKSAHFLEALNALYVKVKLFSPEAPIRSLSVTSATKGDGKSTVAVYLAQAAAETGQRVLLVDANLRHPQIHLRLGLKNTKGLSELLSEGLDFTEVIKRSPTEENLFVLTAGEIPSNPTKLLSSKRMQTLLDRLPSNFDLVIYDTAHLVGLLDGYLVSGYTNGTLLVVGLGNTSRPSLKQVLDEAKTARVSILGLVTNAVKS